METDLSLQTEGPLPPELPTDEYSQKGELWDGIIGVRGQYGRKGKFLRDLSFGGPVVGVSFRF